MGTKLFFSSPYHHNTNGIVERQFRTIRDYINSSSNENKKKKRLGRNSTRDLIHSKCDDTKDDWVKPGGSNLWKKNRQRTVGAQNKTRSKGKEDRRYTDETII